MKRASYIFPIVISTLTLLSYLSVLISPRTLSASGFISLLIPAFLLTNLILSIIFLAKASKKAILPILTLLIGFKFILITVPLLSVPVEGGNFSVLSYNLKWLVEAEKGGGFENALDWMSKDDAKIKCFQEFNARKDIIRVIGNNGEYESVIGGRGNTLAIFSKNKILSSGVLFYEESINNVLYADILIESDTVRIYNVHLESMGINVTEMSTTEEIREAYDKLKNKFIKGSVERTEQIEKLLIHVEGSTYPIIISGDFNDVPYSYNYFKFKREFSNAFEEVGRGFGFTFNGGLPFLRIDHQFYNSKIKAHKYETFSDVVYSDHFPIKCKYSLGE